VRNVYRKNLKSSQGDRAERDASGGPLGFLHSRWIGRLAVIQAVVPSVGVDVSPVNLNDALRGLRKWQFAPDLSALSATLAASCPRSTKDAPMPSAVLARADEVIE
jgi:hypothetical protein